MDLINISGIGPKTAKALNKLDIYDDYDLASYYPYRYNIYNFSNLNSSSDNVIINAIIESSPSVFYIKRNLNRLTFRASYEGKTFSVSIFNRAFLKPNLFIGKEVTIIGKYDIKKNTLVARDIKQGIKNGDIEPVYHLTKGITNSSLRKYIASSLNSPIQDNIPSKYSEAYKFISKNKALSYLHFPKNSEEIKQAKIRLIYEELFEFSFKMNVLKKENKEGKGISHKFAKEKLETAINSLPFKLTIDQQKALDEILEDLQKTSRMNRLLLGDVGSGKTIVAALSAYAVILSGYQVALMAPTEILAMQHYKSIKWVLDKFNINIDVLTGSMTQSEKKNILKRANEGEINLLIGTHTLLNNDLNFQNLGLVITDEQHRFGVNQRDILQKKSEIPDILYLSATPIPRTYALTIYGDLDISIIKSKPQGRKEIITKVMKEKDIKEVLQAMLDEIKLGHQIYIVSPLVEQNDELDLSSVNFLKEKIDLAYQGKIKTEIIHGKLKQAQKDTIMNDFKNNVIKILISTTVIEVGIDVPNATMMVIFNAERFGLATLHQLRGRVGRSDVQSYCYLISDYDTKRLKVMEESNDGFYISEKDFEIRGHGDLFGVRQSGDMKFKLANLKNDYKILLQAKKDSEEYLKSKEYENNSYYKSISESLDIAD